MQRLIKFRARHVKTGRWWYGSSGVDYCSYLNKPVPIYALAEFWGYVRRGILNPETEGQYTDSKDKNGAEIYERDILQSNGYRNREVKWADEIGGFVIGQIAEFYRAQRMEVVGNIDESPELLKVEQNA